MTTIVNRLYAAVTAAASAFGTGQAAGQSIEWCVGAAVLAALGALGLQVGGGAVRASLARREAE